MFEFSEKNRPSLRIGLKNSLFSSLPVFFIQKKNPKKTKRSPTANPGKQPLVRIAFNSKRPSAAHLAQPPDRAAGSRGLTAVLDAQGQVSC